MASNFTAKTRASTRYSTLALSVVVLIQSSSLSFRPRVTVSNLSTNSVSQPIHPRSSFPYVDQRLLRQSLRRCSLRQQCSALTASSLKPSNGDLRPAAATKDSGYHNHAFDSQFWASSDPKISVAQRHQKAPKRMVTLRTIRIMIDVTPWAVSNEAEEKCFALSMHLHVCPLLSLFSFCSFCCVAAPLLCRRVPVVDNVVPYSSPVNLCTACCACHRGHTELRLRFLLHY